MSELDWEALGQTFLLQQDMHQNTLREGGREGGRGCVHHYQVWCNKTYLLLRNWELNWNINDTQPLLQYQSSLIQWNMTFVHPTNILHTFASCLPWVNDTLYHTFGLLTFDPFFKKNWVFFSLPWPYYPPI